MNAVYGPVINKFLSTLSTQLHSTNTDRRIRNEYSYANDMRRESSVGIIPGNIAVKFSHSIKAF